MVRAAPDREQTRTARISLASAFGASALALLVWMYMKEPPPTVPTQRTLSSFPVTWICEKNPNHRFIANGRFQSLPCRECDGRCYIQLTYICPVHKNTFDVFVQFEQVPPDDPANEPSERISLYRLTTSSPWVEYKGNIPCPVPGCTAITKRPKGSWQERSAANTQD